MTASAAADNRQDAGFSLVEVIVAIVLFSVLSTALLRVLLPTIETSTDSGSRLVASDLATRELEITRDTFASQLRGPTRVPTGQVTNAHPLPGGRAGDPLVVDGVSYTVRRTAQWRNIDSAAQTTCDEGGTLEFAYLRVRVEVSWPGLGDRPPVTMNTQMTPRKGTYDVARPVGHIGLKVLDRLGAGRPGVQVTARSGGTTRTTTTGADGCAFLDQLNPGSWTVTVDTPGFVTPQGEPTGSVTASVQTGKLWAGSIVYDQAARMEVRVCPPPGHALPTSLYGSSADTRVPVTLANSGLLPSGSKPFAAAGTRDTRVCPGGDGEDDGDRVEVVETRTIESLWPYAAGYRVWLGGCLDNDPRRTGGTGDLPAASDPGELTRVTVRLAALTIRGAPVGTPLVATQVTTGVDGVDAETDTACRDGQRVELGPAPSGALRTSLPHGRWRVAPAGATPDAGVVVDMAADSGPQEVTL